MTTTIADLPIWEQRPKRVTVEVTRREAEIINALRSIASDEVYCSINSMIIGMVDFHNRHVDGKPKEEGDP